MIKVLDSRALQLKTSAEIAMACPLLWVEAYPSLFKDFIVLQTLLAYLFISRDLETFKGFLEASQVLERREKI